MEGTTFELRPTGPVYPLPFDQRLAQGDNYRKDKETLEKTLQSIHNFYKTPYASPHTGEHLECERCIGLKRQVKQAYREWYLSEEPDRWYSKLFDYKTELQAMFEKPDEYDLAAIHQRADMELRSHLKKDICAHAPGDTKDTIRYKSIATHQLDEGKSIAEILKAYFENQFTTCPDSALVDFIRELNATTRDEERIPIYIRYYCAGFSADNTNIKNFKAKYSRMFEQGIPHDTVVAAMRKEVSTLREVEVSDLQRRLNELNLAQSAHLKAKAKKAKKDQMKDQRNMSLVEESRAVCGYEDCSKDINLGVDEGSIQCAVCVWIEELIIGEKSTYYCSPDHARIDHETHNLAVHPCIAISTNSCINEPFSGPPESFEASGLCRDCIDQGRKAFYCSQECYTSNLGAHRHENHAMEGDQGQEFLELFRVPENLNVVADNGFEDIEMKED